MEYRAVGGVQVSLMMTLTWPLVEMEVRPVLAFQSLGLSVEMDRRTLRQFANCPALWRTKLVPPSETDKADARRERRRHAYVLTSQIKSGSGLGSSAGSSPGGIGS